jgi:transketolase
MEGISQEAIDFAGHMGLGKLIVFWDDNRITIDGPTDLSTSMDQRARFEAAGWHVQEINGHDKEAIAGAIDLARRENRPSMIACRTMIGFGSPAKQGTSGVHGAPLGEAEIEATRKALGWPHGAFEIPDPVYQSWRAIAERGALQRQVWEDRLNQSEQKEEFATTLAPPDAKALQSAIQIFKEGLSESQLKVATRKASEITLDVIHSVLPNLAGGSADLTGSNNTRAKAMMPVSKNDFSGSYIHYGIREHGMAAIMNGLGLHGGFLPYGGTFLAFADYCRPAMRLSALMEQPVVYVMTHDSIGLGEDGPTHQPVETIASLRAMPNMDIFRPADAVETAEAWELALLSPNTPSVLCLSRQGLPTIRKTHNASNMTAKGAYVLREAAKDRDVTLFATGSEVAIALEAADILEEQGILAAVVSVPCFELFMRQGDAYRLSVLGTAPRVGVEAAVRQGWSDLLGPDSAFVGMQGFGASAPADDLYRHFGITAENVAQTATDLIS